MSISSVPLPPGGVVAGLQQGREDQSDAFAVPAGEAFGDLPVGVGDQGGVAVVALPHQLGDVDESARVAESVALHDTDDPVPHLGAGDAEGAQHLVEGAALFGAVRSQLPGLPLDVHDPVRIDPGFEPMADTGVHGGPHVGWCQHRVGVVRHLRADPAHHGVGEFRTVAEETAACVPGEPE
ncbi:hypothetical protein [Streptomyces sp. NPDC006368]|uniref:hypothetical protein n=1 Tax=Streptomyces sp. NPDC006368 TaxID=3156760 RepID=UPI0033BEBA1E